MDPATQRYRWICILRLGWLDARLAHDIARFLAAGLGRAVVDLWRKQFLQWQRPERRGNKRKNGDSTFVSNDCVQKRRKSPLPPTLRNRKDTCFGQVARRVRVQHRGSRSIERSISESCGHGNDILFTNERRQRDQGFTASIGYIAHLSRLRTQRDFGFGPGSKQGTEPRHRTHTVRKRVLLR